MSTQVAERTDPITGEFEETTQTSLAVQLSRAEVDQQVGTALAYPRDGRKGGLRGIVNKINSLATLSEDAAKECVYALPRGGKPIRGPSVRLAEIVASQWGNCRIGARVVHVDKFEKYVEAEGIFHDLETNTATTSRVRRRIVDKHGKLFNDDMILVTGNAAASIAKRNAIFGGVPKAIWNESYMAADAVIAGDVKTLAERRDNAIKAFAAWGVKPEQIFAALEIEGLDDLNLDKVATLGVMYQAIKSEEQTVEDYFPPVADQSKAADAAKGTAAKLGNIANKGKDKAPEGDKPADDKAKTEGGDKPAQAAATGGDKPAGGNTAGNDQTAQAASGAAETGNAGGEPAAITDADREAAFQRGKAAREKGMSRKATPTEWREAGKEALLEAYLAGFDE